MLDQFERNNPNQFGKGVDGYKLGDFNRSGGSVERLENIKQMEAKYSEAAERQREQQTQILKTISNNINKQVAVAG